MAASCSIGFEKMFNVANNKDLAKVLPAVTDNATRLELVRFIHDNTELSTTTNTYIFGKRVGLSKRPSKLAEDLYQKFGGDDKLNTQDTMKQIEVGTNLHEIGAIAGQAYYEAIKAQKPFGSSQRALLANDLKNRINAGAVVKLSDTTIMQMIDTAIAVVDTILKKQEEINVRDSVNGMPEIFFEHRMINPIDDIGGTGDVVAFYSDGGASYFDYKTFEPAVAFKAWDKQDKVYNVDGKIAYRDYRRQKWEVSIPAYVKMLKNVYKATRIYHARAIPVATFFKKTDEYAEAAKKGDNLRLSRLQKEGRTRANEIYNIDSFAMEDSDLLPAAIYREEVEKQDLNLFLEQRYLELHELHLKLEETRSVEERERLKEKITNVQFIIDSIVVRKDTSAIVDYAVILLKEAKMILKEEDSLERLARIAEIRKELAYYTSILSLSTDYLNKLKKKDKSAADELMLNISKITQRLNTTIEILNKKLIEELTTHKLLDDQITQQELTSGKILFQEDELIQGKFKGASMSNNPFFRSMKQLYDKVQRENRKRMEDKMKDIEKHFALIEEFKKERGLSDDAFIDLVVDKNTGNLKPKFKPEMYKLIADKISAGDVNFFLDNYEIRENWKARYDIRLANMKEKLEIKHNGLKEKKDKEKYKLDLEQWIIKNDLLNSPAAWMEKYNIKSYLKRKPQFEATYHSEAYKYILSNPKLNAWFEFWTTTMYEADRLLGSDENIGHNFIPWVAKDAIELAWDRNGMIGNDLLDVLSVQYDSSTERYNSIGEVVRRPPIIYTQPFLRNGKLDVQKKSMNLERSLMLFMKMAYNYDSKIRSEASVMAIKDALIDFGRVYQKTKKGHIITDPSGKPVDTNRVSKSVIEDFDAYVNFYWYGMRLRTKDKTFEAFGRELSLNETLLAAKNYYSKKALAFSIHAPLAAYFAGKIGTFAAGSKGLLFNNEQHVNAMKWWAEGKVPFSMASDNGQKYKAFLAYFDPSNDNAIDRKIESMTDNIIDKVLSNRSQFLFFSWADEAVIDTMAIAVAQNYGIKDGVLRHKDNLDKNSKSLWDLFKVTKDKDGNVKIDIEGLTEEQKDAVWIKYRNIVREAGRSVIGSVSEEDISLMSTHLMGNMLLQFRTWLPNVAYEMFKGLRYDGITDTVDIGRLTALGESFKGLESGAGLAQHFSLIAKTLLQLLGEIFFLGRLFSDNTLLLDRERALRTYDQWKADNPQLARNVSFDDYVKARKRQVAALVAQLRMLAVLGLIFMFLGADWDDDEEKDYRKTWLGRHGFRVLSRIYTESSSMYNPAEFSRLISGGPIPAWGLFTSMYRIVENGLDEVRDGIIGENSKRDVTPFFYYTMDMIPLIDRYRKIFETTEADLRSSR